MENFSSLVRERRSFRTFNGEKLSQAQKENLMSFAATIENPFGVDIEFRLLEGKKGLSCPVISGTDLFVTGKLKKQPRMNEAFGFSFEQLLLYAQSMKIGTLWVGGTMGRAAFEEAVELGEDECMPCVSPLGFEAEKMSVRESLMRKGIKADSRVSFEELFFDGSFEAPLSREKAGELEPVLELVRWAPSAANRQPWRLLRDENGVHFFLKRAKAKASDVLDMQKIDMGIALCHFAFGAKEKGISLGFSTEAPKVETDMEYIGSYLL